MLNPKLTGKAALAALALGVIFFVANLYLSGSHHPALAKTAFVLAIVCDLAFAVFAVMWSFGRAWLVEPQRPQMPMMGMPPPGAAPGKTPRPPQPQP